MTDAFYALSGHLFNRVAFTLSEERPRIIELHSAEKAVVQLAAEEAMK
jgi:hypothetical protein